MRMFSSETWITCPRPSPQAAVRLFCFPYAGGAASIFTPWTVALPASIEVCPVQYPGRGSRMSDPALTAIQSLAQGLLPVIRTLLDRPFAFFGHSMGALVSFELARLLQLEGKVPAQIFASAHRAPQLPDPDPPLHQLPTPELIDQLRQLNGTPPEVLDHAELLELMLPMLRADFAACETYQYVPGPSLTCPLTAFGGLRDMHITREMLDAWRMHTSGPFAVRMFPGDHFFLNSDRQLLLTAIARDLSQRVRLNAGARGAS